MLNTPIKIVIELGALYLAIRAGFRYADQAIKANPEPSVGDTVKDCATGFAIGFGIGALSPITGPIGLVIASKDVYDNRQRILGWVGASKPKPVEVHETQGVKLTAKGVEHEAGVPIRKSAKQRANLSTATN